MTTPIRVTFDSNTWRPLVSPATFAKDPMFAAFEKIRFAISADKVRPFLSESIFTLEALARVDRQAFFAGYLPDVKVSSEFLPDGQIKIQVSMGSDQSRQAANTPHLDKHLREARAIGAKILPDNAIAGVRNPDLTDDLFAADDLFPQYDRQERCGKCAREIEQYGAGIAHIKVIGQKYAKGGPWLKGIQAAPPTESNAIAKAVAEWSDGDAIAAHYGFGNHFFCTRDRAKAAGGNSVFSSKNKAWLERDYGIVFVSPDELAARL